MLTSDDIISLHGQQQRYAVNEKSKYTTFQSNEGQEILDDNGLIPPENEANNFPLLHAMSTLVTSFAIR